ncbi:MAG: 4Fe-4S dicluster domain-containing protein, partial [Bacillota bacterium]
MPRDELVQVATECGRCGSCRAVCPVWRELGWESWSPRGKLAMARRAAGESARQATVGPFTGRLTEVLSRCALCGACDRVCGTCLDLRGTWLSARARFCPGIDAYRKIRDAVV